MNCKFCIKYLKMANNVMQIKEHFKTYISYFKDISNMKSQIINKHNQKKQKSDINIINILEKRKKQVILNVLQISR